MEDNDEQEMIFNRIWFGVFVRDQREPGALGRNKDEERRTRTHWGALRRIRRWVTCSSSSLLPPSRKGRSLDPGLSGLRKLEKKMKDQEVGKGKKKKRSGKTLGYEKQFKLNEELREVWGSNKK